MKSFIISILLALFFNTGLLVSQNVNVTFNVHVSCNTPKDDTVFLYQENERLVKFQKVSDNDWKAVISFTPGYQMYYRYCRNRIWFGADELLPEGWNANRFIDVPENGTVVYDTVKEWKWWPVDGQFSNIDQSAYMQAPPDSLPLINNFQGGVFLPDWWDSTFLFNVNSTLDSIVEKSNANFVEFCPIPEITQFYPTPIINKVGNNSIDDESLNYVLQSVKKRNLGLYLHPFVWAINVSDTSPSYHTNEWWIAYEQQWRPIMLDYAQLAEDYNSDVLVFTMWPMIWFISEPEVPVIDSLATSLLNDVKAIYHGKIAIDFNPFGPDMNIYSQGDYLHFVIADFWPYQLADNKEPSVDTMYQNLNEGLEQLYQQTVVKWGKDVIIGSLAASSYDGTVINQPDWESQLYYFPNDTSVALDVQEQADAYEAMLHALTTKDWIKGVYSFNYNYWNSYDKAPSVRNKPAEKVLAKWLRWKNPQTFHFSIYHNEGGYTVPGKASYVFSKDTTLQVTAFPVNDNYIFSHWEGDIDSSQMEINPITLSLTGDFKIKAVFKKVSGLKVLSNKSSEIKVFPNPVKNRINIKCNFNLTDDVKIVLTGISGKTIKVFNQSEIKIQNKNYITVDITNIKDLKAGNYIITLKNRNVKFSKAIEIIR